jgi:hypothetical protein
MVYHHIYSKWYEYIYSRGCIICGKIDTHLNISHLRYIVIQTSNISNHIVKLKRSHQIITFLQPRMNRRCRTITHTQSMNIKAVGIRYNIQHIIIFGKHQNNICKSGVTINIKQKINRHNTHYITYITCMYNVV